MTLLSWLRPRPADEVTAATRAWLDHEARAEVSARAQLMSWQVRYGAARAELRERNRAYGRASATIGSLRGQLAREREGRLLVERLGRAGMLPVQARPADEQQRAADAALVATAEHLGNEVEPDRTAAIKGAAATLRAHRLNPDGPRSSCTCGWGAEAIRPDGPDKPGYYSGPDELARHIAEQLAAAGALGGAPRPRLVPRELVDKDGDHWHLLADGRYVVLDEDDSTSTRDEIADEHGPLTVFVGALAVPR